MKNLMKRVGLISGVLIAGFSGVSSAQAGNIKLLSGQGNFTPVIFSGSGGAGVNLKIRSDNFGGTGGGTGDSTTAGANAIYAGGSCLNIPTNTPGYTGQCGYFDFFPTSNLNPATAPITSISGANFFVANPPTSTTSTVNTPPINSNSGLGLIQLVSISGEPPTAFNDIQGQQGLIKDFKLPYLGTQNNFNPNLNIPITRLLDFGRDKIGDIDTANTFDATKLTNVTFRPTNNGASSEASFQFEGFWNVLENGAIVQAAGIVVLSQGISAPINTVITQAQGNNGFTSGYSGQTQLTSIPEPNALVGLAVFAGAGTLLNRKRKSK
ncbi:hypothetical protein [Aphanothece sacrum]|uniref:PEP-CTERM sorting domain-containing protein n=1 Tax=Aphanothece sacrum FPU1 TaxID=1920663 RepID=A0A401IDF8_APHSA|nr:hypothetical protein [Aphanothece sacrum]GBF79266.1 hypothetical protein AsFPU1_0659 [Aphanothece sacrum FPU1]GBF86768.1 hypothetical protein AsFPU3_3841 [Aphanothece sacrum FPU3]